MSESNGLQERMMSKFLREREAQIKKDYENLCKVHGFEIPWTDVTPVLMYHGSQDSSSLTISYDDEDGWLIVPPDQYIGLQYHPRTEDTIPYKDFTKAIYKQECYFKSQVIPLNEVEVVMGRRALMRAAQAINSHQFTPFLLNVVAEELEEFKFYGFNITVLSLQTLMREEYEGVRDSIKFEWTDNHEHTHTIYFKDE